MANMALVRGMCVLAVAGGVDAVGTAGRWVGSNLCTGMIGSILGAAVSAAGSIFGGIQASKAMRKVKDNVEAQRSRNKAWYERRYNEDATQRADAQRILARTEAAIRERNMAAAGTQAVMGGSEESLAAVKAANNEAMADAVSRIVAQGEARKDAVEARYQQREAALDEQLNNLETGRAQGISQAVGGLSSVGANLADAFGKDVKEA